MGEGEKAEPVPTKAKWRWLLDDVKPLLPTRKADVGSVDDSIKEVPNEHKAILEALSIGDDSDLDDSSDDNDTSTTASSPQKAAKRKRILELQQGWRAKRPALEVLGDLSPELQHQWETFYRSGLDRTTIKKLMTALVGGQAKCTTDMATVMMGIGKVFVCHLVEQARLVQREWATEPEGADPLAFGPLTPAVILEAHRRLQ